MLRGRTREQEVLERLLENARGGRSGVLVLRGEAGIGKTALLEHAVARASGFRVARAVGVESEMELAFAGLHQLCAPLLGALDALPEPQRGALGAAFGLAPGRVADHFLIAVAALSLLSEVAERQPLLCVVDDVHWLDRASAQALGFVARRLLAEPVALLLAVRTPEPDLAALPELELAGLDADDARAVLATVTPGVLDERVRDRIVAETRGNPLALLELPRGLTAAQLAGGFALPDAAGVPGQIEDRYVQRLAELPAPTRRLLLLAAADPAGDTTLLMRAARALGLEPGVAAPTELLELGAHARFRHPLVRSAVYRAASPEERRAAHAALAAATHADGDRDRRAWHLAHAAGGPDEQLADELIHCAGRAQRRGGVAAAAAFWERAVTLTPDAGERAGRALSAAGAKFAAGDLRAAEALLAIAGAESLDALGEAQVQRMRAQVVFALRRGTDAPPLLLAAARRLEPLDPALARETHLEALLAAIYAGRLAPAGEIARAALAAPVGPEPLPSRQRLLLGLGTRLTGRYAAAAPALREVLRAPAPALDWVALAHNIAAMDLFEDHAWFELASAQVRLARADAMLSLLPYALDYLAEYWIQAGELARARALLAEAERIDPGARAGTLPYVALLLAAWSGDAPAATNLAATMTRAAATRGEGCALTVAEYATAVLNNGRGEYRLAYDAAERASAPDDIATSTWALAELVEAAARSGLREAATAALGRLSERTAASGTAWARGIEARSCALVADGAAAEALHREAIASLEGCGMATHLARARLHYGEWLRREGRRVDAREQLRSALDAFEAMGLEAFAERARRELVATAAKLRPRRDEARDELTPQEGQIARLAAEGRTNPEIGAQLFLSPRTVEWHLGKVFAKLGVGSRHALRDALEARIDSRHGSGIRDV